MAAEPAAPGPYEAIHLSGPGRRRGAGGRLPAPARPGAGRLPEGLEDAEDTAAMLEWKGWNAVGQTSYMPHDEVRRRRGSAPVSLRIEYGSGRSARRPRYPGRVRCCSILAPME